MADSLATRLVEAIRSLGLPAERVAGAALPEVNDLVIEGDFVRIDEGSRLKRFVIGLGVGATELRTQVRVFQGTAEGWKLVQQFETVATGSRLPGAGFFVAGGAVAGMVATSAAITSGVGVLRELRASIDADARRTAEQIAGKVSELKTAQAGSRRSPCSGRRGGAAVGGARPAGGRLGGTGISLNGPRIVK